MSNSEKVPETIDADVLVIGGGFAGVWAAIRAREFVDNVVLVDKAKVARSGCSTFAAGVQLCPTTADDFEIWKREIVEAGEYFPDQEWVDVFLNNQADRINDYEKWGAPFERDDKGRISRLISRGHKNTRLFEFHGPKLMEILKKVALGRNVKLVERTMAVDLLTSDGLHPSNGKVVGAIGFDTRTGEFRILKAGATVIATGPIWSKRGSVFDNCTGDGIASAFRAGAELSNMEFCTVGNITAWERKAIAGGIQMIQGYGAHFLNSRGERFMEKYDPVLKERALLHKLCMAFTKEQVIENRGPITVDMRHFSKETWTKFERVLPRTMKVWKDLGIDVSRQTINCQASWGVGQFAGQGGIEVDHACRTSLEGLYAAAAAARNPIQGPDGIGGVETAACNVMGYVAGENAAKYALDINKDEVNLDQYENLKKAARSFMENKEGARPRDIFVKLDKISGPPQFSMFKRGDRIIKVLSEISKIKEEIPGVQVSDSHEMVKANELRNYSLCAELIFRAALERKESRQFHYREEYPYRDDKEWLKLILFKRVKEGIALHYQPIPVEKWSIKPERWEKISHPVQVFLNF